MIFCLACFSYGEIVPRNVWQSQNTKIMLITVFTFITMLSCLSKFQTITEIYETTTTRTTTSDYEQSEPSKSALTGPEPGKPAERKKVVKKKVDSSKFMTPYIAHSQKMQDLFSTVSFNRTSVNLVV